MAHLIDAKTRGQLQHLAAQLKTKADWMRDTAQSLQAILDETSENDPVTVIARLVDEIEKRDQRITALETEVEALKKQPAE